jgi:fructose-bisphosphate aldolase class I
MTEQTIQDTAIALVPKGKGILACDESLRSTTRRFKLFDIPHTPENREAYRDMMFTTPELNNYISGVILFDETVHQSAHDGTPFPEYLAERGIIPGIKVDEGYADMAGFPKEKVSRGLDNLSERLREYKQHGLHFAKWRAVILIEGSLPSRACIRANAHALARYAAICQSEGFVPIVEPDVLIHGNHNLERCEEVSSLTLREVFYQLQEHKVSLEGMLLKPNMVLPGVESKSKSSVEDVADATLRTLKRHVPPAVPGIVFLSGGQGSIPATAHLNAMNAKSHDLPWELSFSYLRALADPAYEIWKGKKENFDDAQKVFHERAKLVAAARKGEYTPDMEKMAA